MNPSVLAVLTFTTFTATALADDLAPPPWRFNPGTTVQHWDFTAGPAGGAPDAGPLNNPYGTPTLAPGFGSTWQAAGAGRSDVWSMPGIGWLNFSIPNTGNAANQKELWLQVTYFSLTPPQGPVYAVASQSIGVFSLLGSQVTPLPGGWIHELTRWSAAICPPSELVSIAPVFVTGSGPNILVDQVVIDTQCIPAPAATAIVPIFGLALMRSRRMPLFQ